MRYLLLVGLGLLAPASPIHADGGLFDNGFFLNRARSDYADRYYGTSNANPLRFDDYCPYAKPFPQDPLMIGSIPQCPHDRTGTTLPPLRTVWPSSNYFSVGDVSFRFWSLSANNENWYAPENSGPPNQSLPIWDPTGSVQTSVFGFKILRSSLPGEQNLQRAHLIVNQLDLANPQPDGTPYLEFSADYSKGNGGILGRLNSPSESNILRFTERLWDTTECGAPFAYLVVSTEWANKPRVIILNLYSHEANLIPVPVDPNVGIGLTRHWNWPMTGSMYNPGAEIAFLDAGASLNARCPSLQSGSFIPRLTPTGNVVPVGPDQSYAVDLTELFACASQQGRFSDPMPRNELLPIRHVGWAVEGAFRTKIWASVHNMRIDRRSPCFYLTGEPADADSPGPGVVCYPTEAPTQIPEAPPLSATAFGPFSTIGTRTVNCNPASPAEIAPAMPWPSLRDGARRGAWVPSSDR